MFGYSILGSQFACTKVDSTTETKVSPGSSTDIVYIWVDKCLAIPVGTRQEEPYICSLFQMHPEEFGVGCDLPRYHPDGRLPRDCFFKGMIPLGASVPQQVSL